MLKNFSFLALLSMLAVISVSAQSEDLPFLYNRQVVSKPEIITPQEASVTKLSGTVKVLVTVDSLGNVLSVGKASGPGSVCDQVDRADVTALRNAASEAARLVKFAPAGDGQPTIARSWVEIEFPKLVTANEETAGAADKSRTISPEANAAKSRDTNKFTVKGDINFSAAGPPPDYTGPVSTTGGSGTGAAPDSGKYTVIPEGTYTAAASNGPGYAVGGTKISGGVLNGKALSLTRPRYPRAAMAVRAAGAVSTQVLIDTDGKVFSAYAVSGHPLLRPASVAAACGSAFSPTLLMGQPVKVSGIITYNFVP